MTLKIRQNFLASARRYVAISTFSSGVLASALAVVAFAVSATTASAQSASPRDEAIPDGRHEPQGEAGLRSQGEAGLRSQGEAGFRSQGEAGLKGKREAGLKTKVEVGRKHAASVAPDDELIMKDPAVHQKAYDNEASPENFKDLNNSLGPDVKVETSLGAPSLGGDDRHEVWNLAQVKKIVEGQNPDLKAARANYEAASARILQAWSGYLPHADISANFEQTNLSSPSVNTQVGEVLPYSSVIAKIRQTIFDFGKTLSAIGAATASSHASGEQMQALHNAVLLQAESAYFNKQSAEKLTLVSKQGLAKFAEIMRRTQLLVKTGVRPKFDLSQAEVQYSKAKLALTNAQNTDDLARIALLNIMGIPQSVSFDLVEITHSSLVDLSRLNIAKLSQLAIQNRPEMRADEYNVKADQMRLHGEYQNYLPTLDIEGWYGRYLPNYADDMRDSWGAGLALNWNLFDGLNTTGRVQELGALLEASSEVLEKRRQDVVAQVAKSVMDMKRSTANLEVARDSLSFASENASLAKKRYEASVATFLELITSETSLLDAEAVEVQARYQYETALASLQDSVNLPLEELLK